MKIKFVELEEGFLPKKMSAGASAMDVFARDVSYDEVNGYLKVKLGFSVEVDESLSMLALPRSSVSDKGLHLANSVGIIDPDFRGEVQLRFYPAVTPKLFKLSGPNLMANYCLAQFHKGEAVGQVMFIKNETNNIEVEKVDTLTDTVRGIGGFGSTNKNENVKGEKKDS
jgi:dUTP pyrophosphatase